jgi:hemolysin activation/secretion protein
MALALAGLGSLPAHAQSASQITPKSFAPPVAGPAGHGLGIATPGDVAPPGAETLFVTPSGVEFIGGFADFAAEQARIRARVAGRRISGAEIYAAARDLEAAYARAGYVLVRVTVPAQDIVDGGVIKLRVIDGYIERIETGRLPWRARARIAAMVASLAGHGHLRQQDLERRLLLAGDAPGVTLRSTLAPGSTTGAAVLVLEGSDQPVGAVLTGDNSLPRSLGAYQLGGGFNLNSLLGGGEETYLRASGYPIGGGDGFLARYARNRILAAGMVAPLGEDGLTFNVEATLSRTTPIGQGGLQSTDQFERLSFRLRYPWLRGRSLNFSSQLVLDVQNEEAWLLAGQAALPLSLDRVRVLRVINEAGYLAPWGGAVSASLTPSFGLSGLGARTAAQASATLPLSVQRADASFQKLAASLSYNQAIARHLSLALSANAQTSFGRPLVHSEEVGISGPGQLSAFDAGTLQGDSGYVGRVEVAAPFALPTPRPFARAELAASPYLFGAYGEVFLAQPTALQRARIPGSSFGLGLRVSGAGAGSTGAFSLEYARRNASDGAPGGDRLTASGSIGF